MTGISSLTTSITNGVGRLVFQVDNTLNEYSFDNRNLRGDGAEGYGEFTANGTAPLSTLVDRATMFPDGIQIGAGSPCGPIPNEDLLVTAPPDGDGDWFELEFPMP